MRLEGLVIFAVIVVGASSDAALGSISQLLPINLPRRFMWTFTSVRILPAYQYSSDLYIQVGHLGNLAV